MDSQQEELLTNLHNFYKNRYTENAEFEKKFREAVEDLIDTGDISRTVFINYCALHNIEPVIKKAPKKYGGYSSSSDSLSSHTRDRYEADPCGTRGGYSRSSC